MNLNNSINNNQIQYLFSKFWIGMSNLELLGYIQSGVGFVGSDDVLEGIDLTCLPEPLSTKNLHNYLSN